MTFLALSGADVERLLTMEACIEAMADVLAALQRGEMIQPLRSTFRAPDAPGTMAWMPARREGAAPVFGMKTLCVMPGNPARGLHAHPGHGRPHGR